MGCKKTFKVQNFKPVIFITVRGKFDYLNRGLTSIFLFLKIFSSTPFRLRSSFLETTAKQKKSNVGRVLKYEVIYLKWCVMWSEDNSIPQENIIFTRGTGHSCWRVLLIKGIIHEWYVNWFKLPTQCCLRSRYNVTSKSNVLVNFKTIFIVFTCISQMTTPTSLPLNMTYSMANSKKMTIKR